MRRIKFEDIIDPTTMETKFIELDINDPFICQKATAYITYPDPLDPRWDNVAYYVDANINFKSIWKTTGENSRVRVDIEKNTTNNWLEDLKNLEF
jgi:hypothetical protein